MLFRSRPKLGQSTGQDSLNVQAWDLSEVLLEEVLVHGLAGNRAEGAAERLEGDEDGRSQRKVGFRCEDPGGNVGC